MKIDEKEFFRESVLRICGNLNIEAAMSTCVQYLKTIMPLDVMFLEVYEWEMESLRIIARATAEAGRKRDIIAPLPANIVAEAQGAIVDSMEKLPSSNVWLVNRPDLVPTSKTMQEFLGEPESSMMGMHLIVNNNPLGLLVVLAEGKNRYTEGHARLISLLNEPFYIALSNTLEHMEVLRLQEMLVDDNKYLHHELRRISGEDIVGGDFGLKGVMEMTRQLYNS